MPSTKLSNLRYRREIFTLLFASLTAWLSFTWTLVIQRIIRYYNPFPSWDYWRIPYNAYFSKTLGFQLFLKPHNEHRIIFPELIFQIDLLLFHERIVLPLVISFLCYFATALILVWAISRDRTVPASLRAFAAFLASLILGWQGSAVVLGDPILLQWTLSSLCAVIAIFFVARDRFFICALIAAVTATYSSGNCLLLWPVLILEAWLRKTSRRRITAIIITGSAAISLYFIGYHPASKLDLPTLLRHPLHVLGFLTSYMSMPFGLSRSDAFAILLGSINILTAVLLFLYARRWRMLRSETPLVLFGTYFFTFLTAVLITVGRINLAGGYGDAKASRFWSVQLLNWADVALLAIYFTAKANLGFRSKLAVYSAMVILIAFGTLKLRSSLHYDDDQFANRQLAALSFESGLQDAGLARRIFPSPAFVFSLVPFLRSHDLSVYSLSTAKSLGKPMSTVGKIVDQPRPGSILSALPVEDGIELIGWAEPERNGSERIIFANDKGEIAGFGRKLRAGFPTDLRSLATPVSEAWVGFVNLKYASHTVAPYFVSHGRLQPMHASVPVETGIERVKEDTGVPIANIQWHMDPAWTTGGIPPAQYAGNIPRGTVYGSSSGDDHNRGVLTSSSFPAPTTACLEIPVSHGPSVGGLSVEITDAATGHVLRGIPLQNGDLGWQFWTVTLDRSIGSIRIVAKDEGAGWGEWLAVAQPSECGASAQ